MPPLPTDQPVGADDLLGAAGPAQAGNDPGAVLLEAQELGAPLDRPATVANLLGKDGLGLALGQQRAGEKALRPLDANTQAQQVTGQRQPGRPGADDEDLGGG